MVTKQALLKENALLRKRLFIMTNIRASAFSSVQEKEEAVKEFLERYPEFTFYEVCPVIKLNKGTYFHYINDKVPKKQNIIKDETLLPEIKRIFVDSGGVYGHRKILAVLRQEGFKTSEAKISSLMKKLGLQAPKGKKARKAPEPGKNVFLHNFLGRNFVQSAPNKAWVSDFMEIRIGGAKFYLCVILDLFARFVVGWRVAPKRSASLALGTFKDAFESRGEPSGLLFHSDQGAEYTSYEFRSTLRALGIKQSFSNPGVPYDNAVMESFYSVLRREEINRNSPEYGNYKGVKEHLARYFEFYNHRRVHKALGYRTPNAVEIEFFEAKKG